MAAMIQNIKQNINHDGGWLNGEDRCACIQVGHTGCKTVVSSQRSGSISKGKVQPKLVLLVKSEVIVNDHQVHAEEQVREMGCKT